jgi:Glycosyltransferase sugar-binding region containing DXD motif
MRVPNVPLREKRKAKVPNVIHFIYPVWHNTRPLSYLNYMAVKRASVIQKPDKIKFWINKDPEPSLMWDMIKPLVEVNYIPMDGFYNGTKILWPQLQSDVTRLEILYKEGGIYMDTDMLMLRPLEDQLFSNFHMCLEPSKGEPTSACNALMISEPEASFVDIWLSHMEEALKSDTWAYGGVVKPLELAKVAPDLVTMGSNWLYCPLDLSKNWLFSTDKAIIDEAKWQIQFSFAVHAFETYWRDVVKDITPDWCKQNDSLFSRLVI